jgi:dolichol-phosphate mannosyltransferase/undecaprenyl-phosphate 4-deoxy-4-formamido-L-arabinose transferase
MTGQPHSVFADEQSQYRVTPRDADVSAFERGERRRLISVVIPVYNSRSLEALADGIDAVLRDGADDYEILFVDDGSSDADVWPTLARLARERRPVRATQLTRNFGQQAATLCGLQAARGDLVITLDDDLQHDPVDIPLLLGHADHLIVIAQFEHKQHGVLRRLASRAKGVFDQIVIGKPRDLQLSSFRLLHRTVVNGMLAIRTPNPFLPALMFHVSKDVVGVTVRHAPRAGGRSGYTLWKLLRVFSNLIINNSSILLRAVATTGFVFAVASFGLAAFVVYHKLIHQVRVQGWTSLVAAILLIGGLILVSIGIIGEYLIRIIQSSETRPTYFVRRQAD